MVWALLAVGAATAGCGGSAVFIDGRVGGEYMVGATEPELGWQLGFGVGASFDLTPMRDLQLDWAVAMLDGTSRVRGGKLAIVPSGVDIGVAYRPFGPFGSEFILRYTGMYGNVLFRRDGSDDFVKIDGWSHGLAVGWGYSTISPEAAIGVAFSLDWQSALAHAALEGGQTYLMMGPLLRVALIFPLSEPSPEAIAWMERENEDTHRRFDEQRQREVEAGQRAQEQGQQNYEYQRCLNSSNCQVR